ncbi:hypothetical protein J6590_082049 [Homalodisca vitripennis]|nr:hypothetical protein J6590_082049 [Homalodisca vitripennis]
MAFTSGTYSIPAKFGSFRPPQLLCVVQHRKRIKPGATPGAEACQITRTLIDCDLELLETRTSKIKNCYRPGSVIGRKLLDTRTCKIKNCYRPGSVIGRELLETRTCKIKNCYRPGPVIGRELPQVVRFQRL